MTERMNENVMKALFFIVIFTVLLFHSLLSNTISPALDSEIDRHFEMRSSDIPCGNEGPTEKMNAAFTQPEKPGDQNAGQRFGGRWLIQ